MGPLAPTHPAIGTTCVLCAKPFQVEEFVAVVPLGPGLDREDRVRCQLKLPYTGKGIVVHWDCVSGGAPGGISPVKG